MSEVNERAVDRLDNLNNIEPLLGSLRVLSLSTMQMAQNRIDTLHSYMDEYYRALSTFLSLLSEQAVSDLKQVNDTTNPATLIVLGSERGICGKYNKNLAELALEWKNKQTGEFNIIGFGARIQEALKQSGLPFQYQGSLSQGSRPRFQRANELATGWIQSFKKESIGSLEVLCFRKQTSSIYKPIFTRLLPVLIDWKTDQQSTWPPTIIEGDALELAKRTIEHLAVMIFYDLILESITAENIIRYNLLEEAKENVKEMVESLRVEIQIMKRQKITQQIQEISAGSGLTR